MSSTCFGCKTLPTLTHAAAIPPSLEPIVFVGRMAQSVGQFRAAHECVCCGRRWLERAPSAEMLPRFRLALMPASSLPMQTDLITAVETSAKRPMAAGSAGPIVVLEPVRPRQRPRA